MFPGWGSACTKPASKIILLKPIDKCLAITYKSILSSRSHFLLIIEYPSMYSIVRILSFEYSSYILLYSCIFLNITYKGKKIKQFKYDEWKNTGVEWYYLILNKKL